MCDTCLIVPSMAQQTVQAPDTDWAVLLAQHCTQVEPELFTDMYHDNSERTLLRRAVWLRHRSHAIARDVTWLLDTGTERVVDKVEIDKRLEQWIDKARHTVIACVSVARYAFGVDGCAAYIDVAKLNATTFFVTGRWCQGPTMHEAHDAVIACLSADDLAIASGLAPFDQCNGQVVDVDMLPAQFAKAHDPLFGPALEVVSQTLMELYASYEDLSGSSE